MSFCEIQKVFSGFSPLVIQLAFDLVAIPRILYISVLVTHFVFWASFLFVSSQGDTFKLC